MSEVMSQNDDCYINNSKYSNVDKVIELIDRDNLTKKDRRRVFIHRRAFMCAVLRKEGLSLKNSRLDKQESCHGNKRFKEL